jgi:adenylate cyclase
MTALSKSTEESLAKSRRDALAVLFADLDGFTKLCSQLNLETILTLVQEFQERVTRSVLEWRGEVNNYLGDGTLATFMHRAGDWSPATRALHCANSLSARIDAWNCQRDLTGQRPVSISIGAQYGEVISGPIGTEQRCEITILGDAINVASRLTGLAQRLGASIAAGEDLMINVVSERGLNAPELSNFVRLGEWPVRGREMPVVVWIQPRPATGIPPSQALRLGDIRARVQPTA